MQVDPYFFLLRIFFVTKEKNALYGVLAADLGIVSVLILVKVLGFSDDWTLKFQLKYEFLL